MIRRSILIASTAVALTVAGCGGGDDDPTPSPTPTPTPTPSPSASATPTYSTFPLPAATEVFTVSAGLSYTGDPASGAVTLGTATTDGFSNRVRLALQNDVTTSMTAEEVVRESEMESRFTGADLTTAPATTVSEYVFRESTAPTTPGQFTQLELLNNTVEDKVTTDVALARSYVSYAAWWRGDSTAGTKRVTYGTFGYPTVPNFMPTTGNSSYIARIAGRVVTSSGSVQKLGGTVTLMVNYATGLVNLTVNLTREDGSAYGTFTGSGGIPVGSNQFTGSFGSGSPFQGLFYGPNATEIGISFAINGSDNLAAGVVIGRQG